MLGARDKKLVNRWTGSDPLFYHLFSCFGHVKMKLKTSTLCLKGGLSRLIVRCFANMFRLVHNTMVYGTTIYNDINHRSVIVDR